MAVSRRLAVVIIVVAILAVMATLLLIELQKPIVIDINQSTYWIKYTQFGKDYLNITVKNTAPAH